MEHEGHSDLASVLEPPQAPGPVQRDLGIEPRTSYRIARWEAGDAKPVLEASALPEGADLLRWICRSHRRL